MATERRVDRPAKPLVAARRYLDAERGRSKAAALLVSNGVDLLATSAACGDDLRGLERAIATGSSDRDVFVHEMVVSGRSFLLASLGTRVKSVRRVENDLTRILAE